MNSMTKLKVWYGELRTSRGNSIVIHDQALPEATPGRIYLYNSNRHAIIEYVKDIVESNLYDLDDTSLKQAQKNYAAAWKDARIEFLNVQKDHLELTEEVASMPEKAVASPKKTIEEDFVEDEESDEVDYEQDEWNNDEYEE
ncbi:hypothetical protein SOPP22_19595 [Shewanella sp. OPT22]|nr:hypothetical protein SOPP22_19595 [Shewanella sp. OPT22]